MDCMKCKGKGKLECDDQSEWVNTTQYYMCPLCGGSGKAPKYCPTCGQPGDAADGEERAVLEGVDYLVNNVDCDTISLIRR